MPDFLGTLTPRTIVKPVTIVFKGGDGNVKRTTFNPPDDSGYNSAQLSAMVQSLAALSNAGVIRFKGAGETVSIAEGSYAWNDDMYGLQTVCKLTFVGTDQSEINISLPAPKLRFMSGSFLVDPAADTLVADMVADVEAVLNGGAVTYSFAGGALEDAGKLRTVTDPTDDTPA